MDDHEQNSPSRSPEPLPIRRVKLTAVSTLHYVRLVYRALIFLTALTVYILNRYFHGEDLRYFIEHRPLILPIIWTVFALEMVFRFFPSKLESPGCQKQFARNYIKTGATSIEVQDNNAAILVAFVWIVLNGVLGALRLAGIFDDGIMILFCCLFSICDMICILFFCPFQTWFMKNKCCATCRIYNWDYTMMFTPLFFVRSPWAWSLLALSVGLLARWEITFFRHPERFAENTNGYLHCQNCTEKLCAHKRQLKHVWKNIAETKLARLKLLQKTDDDT